MRTLKHATALAFVAAVTATPSLAQKPAVSQEALISEVEVHKGAILRYIDAAPDSMLGFRPTPGVRNFAEQIEHAAKSDALISLLATKGTTKGMPTLGDSAVYLHNKAALRAFSAAAMDLTIATLKGVSDAAMMEQVKWANKPMTRGRALMELLDHFPWTLGQTVPYLRLNGVVPPEYTAF